jgi:hypothetical protein
VSAEAGRAEHYAAELAEGRADGAALIAGTIRDLAEAGDRGARTLMAAFLDRTDKADHRTAGADGGPVAARHRLVVPEGQRRTAPPPRSTHVPGRPHRRSDPA